MSKSLSKKAGNLKHEITIIDINDLDVRESPSINLVVSRGDCFIHVWAISISRSNYERIIMAMNSVDICLNDYNKRIDKRNKIAELQSKK